MPWPLFVVDAFTAPVQSAALRVPAPREWTSGSGLRFTDRPFSGNPAAIVVVDRPQPVRWMQDVAAEMKHSETAFVCAVDDGRWGLRWFTPAAEVELCGHATLATAHALWESGRASAGDPIVFATRSGDLTCRRGGGRIEMTFPALPWEPGDAPPGLLPALGVDEDAVTVLRSTFDRVVVVADDATVRALDPDLRAIAAIDMRGVIVTARAASDAAGVDFVSRYFAPRYGVPEDPVTGSAHCVLGPYWAGVLGRADLEAAQVGPRGGRLGVEVDGDVVRLRGTARTIVRGELVV